MSQSLLSKKFIIVEVIGLVLFALLIAVLVLVVQQPPSSTIALNVPLSSVQDNGIGELLQVQIIFRHGDRTPVKLVKGDPYANYTWKEGFGQLTNQGKQRIFRYGQVLRQRYAQLMEQITPQGINAQSSPIRRCLESSESLLAGLLPPKSSQIWSDSSLASQWQPIAIHTTEPFRSWLLNPTAPCAKAAQIESMVNDLPSVKSFLEQNREFLSQLSIAIRYNFTSWRYAVLVYDSLVTEKYYFGDRFKEPAWFAQLGNDTWHRLRNIAEMAFELFAESRRYLRLRAGLFLNELVAHLNDQPEERQKLLTYATHDLMIAYILQALGLYKEMATFGSGLIVELRTNPNSTASGSPLIRLLYSNVTANYEIYELPLNQSIILVPFCHSTDSYCPVDAFSSALQDLLVDDIEQECEVDDASTDVLY